MKIVTLVIFFCSYCLEDLDNELYELYWRRQSRPNSPGHFYIYFKIIISIIVAILIIVLIISKGTWKYVIDQDDDVTFGLISFLLRAATVSSVSEPRSHTSGQADDLDDPDYDIDIDDFDDPDGDVYEKANDKRMENQRRIFADFPEPGCHLQRALKSQLHEGTTLSR